MKLTELIGKEAFCENRKIGKITDIIVDGEEWKITHFEIELKKKQLSRYSALNQQSKTC